MSTQSIFRPTILAIALAAAFPAASAWADDEISELTSPNTAEAAINLSLQQTMLQASQLAFVKISQLSLFNKM